jgi:hypothetical protein
VQTWLITCFSLPVATTTGRLVLLVSGGFLRHPLRMMAPVIFVSVVVGVSLSLLHVRRRRSLQRGSIS